MKLHALLTAAVLSVGLSAGASAQITGKVLLDGEAPEPEEVNMGAEPKCAAAHADPVLDESIVVGENGELANVVVSIQAPEGKELGGEVPKKPAVLDQVGCQYTPHVLAMMVGQEMLVKNSDPFLHNVHSLAIDNQGFNFGQPNKNPGQKPPGGPPKVAERFVIKCDVHPWMIAHINVFDHPFFAVTKEDGTFEIPTEGLEDGTYTLEIWQEKLAGEPITQEIEVKDGKATVEEVKIPADAAEARGDEEAGADVKLASLEDKSCKLGGTCCAEKKAAAEVAKTE